MSEDKKNGMTVKTNVKKSVAPKTEVSNKAFEPVAIRRTLADGRILDRQCDRSDLAAFGKLGFKPIQDAE